MLVRLIFFLKLHHEFSARLRQNVFIFLKLFHTCTQLATAFDHRLFQLVLEEIYDDAGRVATDRTRRVRRRRLVFFDENTQISKMEFHKQMDNYSDTLREKVTPY